MCLNVLEHGKFRGCNMFANGDNKIKRGLVPRAEDFVWEGEVFSHIVFGTGVETYTFLSKRRVQTFSCAVCKE